MLPGQGAGHANDSCLGVEKEMEILLRRIARAASTVGGTRALGLPAVR